MSTITEFQREKIVPIVAEILNNHKGSGNTIDSYSIIYYLEDVHRITVSPVSFRLIIHYIRVNKLSEPVLANGTGYFTTKNEAYITTYLKGLKGRINSIKDVYDSLMCRVSEKV